MKRLATLALAAGAALASTSVAFAQYYEQPRHYQQHQQHYQPSCPHGYNYRHGKCIEIVVRQHCEHGYVWRDGYCRPVYRQRQHNSY